MVEVLDVSRTLPEVAANYTDPAETERRFRDWGWRGNVARRFEASGNTSSDPDAPLSVYVSIHQFGDPTGASEELDYSFEDQAASTDAVEVDVRRLGDRQRALSLATAEGNEVTLYVRQGPVLIRLTVVSASGDPMGQAVRMLRPLIKSVA